MENKNTHQDSGLIDHTWRMSLSFMIFLMMIRKLGVTSNMSSLCPEDYKMVAYFCS